MKKEIATLEGALQKLSAQEEKYSAELDEALKQYAELKEQAAGMDAAELMDARLAMREEKERSAVDHVKAAYGKKYDPMMMHSRFFALPKKIMEIHTRRCYNYFGYLYASIALTQIRLSLSMKARNDYEIQKSNKFTVGYCDGIRDAVWLSK